MRIAQAVHGTRAWAKDEPLAIVAGCGFPAVGLLLYLTATTSLGIALIRINSN
jgi:hypothetical protein